MGHTSKRGGLYGEVLLGSGGVGVWCVCDRGSM